MDVTLLQSKSVMFLATNGTSLRRREYISAMDK
jgi:hypothetical protein